MKVLKQNGKIYRIPSQLNQFQERLYLHLIDWKWKHITVRPGTYYGLLYDAILPDDIAERRPLLYPRIRIIMEEHLERFPFRVHKFFNHMASSQAANINLFLPILQHPQAASVLRHIKPDLVSIATDYLDHGYRIEFWDEPFGDLGDKTATTGTDADLAIAYYNQSGALSLWLIEHKLTEADFTNCGGFRSKGRTSQHDCTRSFVEIVHEKSTCYYHDVRKFNYWNITQANLDFFGNGTTFTECPFRGGTNQLWRNQLLALAIEEDKRQPYQHAMFSVVRHPGNGALDSTLRDYQTLIGNNSKFTTFASSDVIAAATAHADADLQHWVSWYRELYNV